MSLMLYSDESFSTSPSHLCSVCLLDHCETLQWHRCYYPKSCLLPQMGIAFHSLDCWHYDVEIVNTKDLFVRKNSFSLHYIFCPGVTVKDSDYQKGNPVWEEQHNQFLYLCNRNNLNQRTLKSLLFSGFLWFHSHYLHSNVTWFPVVLVARKHIGFRLEWSNCSVVYHNMWNFHQICFIFKELLWCEQKIFPILMWPLIQ